MNIADTGSHEDKLLTVLGLVTQPWPVKCNITLSQKNNNIDILYYIYPLYVMLP